MYQKVIFSNYHDIHKEIYMNATRRLQRDRMVILAVFR